ncbi:hypothetical protein ACFQLX_01930 [Streptomyces polyrhachis]|uniref:Uncharacterized protein n=1 Tax=Streptomyces polyrhachis TaxID=1282885 RepID=A0ABW2G836_9ACTN
MADIALHAVDKEPEEPPVYAHWRSRIDSIMEQSPSREEQTDQLLALLWDRESAHRAREASWKRSTLQHMEELRWKNALLKQTGATLSHQVALTTRLQARLARRDSVDTVLTDLAGEIRRRDPELAQRIVDVVAVPASRDMPRGAVTLAFAADTRWSLGWFHRKLSHGGLGPEVQLPFVGWSLLAVPAGKVEQLVEATFLYGSRALPVSSLDHQGLVFHHPE